MQTAGFQKTTLLDYPGHLAATVFTVGCNFRCPYCHNKDLVIGKMNETIAEEAFFTHCRKRRGILEGVCVTGGEPSLQPDLKEFLYRLKELSLLVKLDTNGSNPRVLSECLREGLLDYVAMDIKAAPSNYGRAAGIVSPDIDRLKESVRLIKNSGISHEFRTTVVKGIHTIEEFEEIGRWLLGCETYYLQQFVSGENILAGATNSLAAFSKEEMQEMAGKAGKYVDKVYLRGVE